MQHTVSKYIFERYMQMIYLEALFRKKSVMDKLFPSKGRRAQTIGQVSNQSLLEKKDPDETVGFHSGPFDRPNILWRENKVTDVNVHY